MKRTVVTICTLLCLGQPSFANPQAIVKPTREGRGAAMKWLALLDKGQYAASWDRATKSFQERVSKADWIAGMEKLRGEYGKVVSRKFKDSTFAVNPPGLPAGEHETLRFAVKLARRGRAGEVVSMIMQKNGEWRVSGYYLTPVDTPV
jgi:hypothetical protein